MITYLTHFDLDLTAQNVNTNLKNKAWLEINWDPDGAGRNLSALTVRRLLKKLQTADQRR